MRKLTFGNWVFIIASALIVASVAGFIPSQFMFIGGLLALMYKWALIMLSEIDKGQEFNLVDAIFYAVIWSALAWACIYLMFTI